MWGARSCVAGALGLGLASVSSSASAERERVRLDYWVSGNCPSETVFWRELTARTNLAELSRAGQFDRRFEVRITTSEDGYAGQLAIFESDGERANRAIDDANCDELVRALAFVAAVAVQERARHEETRRDVQKEERRDTKHPGMRLGAGADAVAMTGPAPQPLYAIGGRFELGTGGGRLSPWLAITGMFADSEAIGVADDLASFRWLGARLDGCLRGWPSGSPLHLGPCVFVDIAALSVRGTGAQRPGEATRFWAAGGFLAAARLDGPERLFIDLHAGVLFPATRDDFVFLEPRILVHDVPGVGFTAGATIGYHFW